MENRIMIIDKSFKKWESIKDLAISVDWGKGDAVISIDNPFDDSSISIIEWNEDLNSDNLSMEPDGRGFFINLKYNSNFEELDNNFLDVLKKTLIYIKKNKRIFEIEEDSEKGFKILNVYIVEDVDYSTNGSLDKTARIFIDKFLNEILK